MSVLFIVKFKKVICSFFFSFFGVLKFFLTQKREKNEQSTISCWWSDQLKPQMLGKIAYVPLSSHFIEILYNIIGHQTAGEASQEDE